MEPVRPNQGLPKGPSTFWEFAKDQPEYATLPAMVEPDGTVHTQWDLSEGERLAIALGAPVLLTVYTAGGPLQPLLPVVGSPSAVKPLPPEAVERLRDALARQVLKGTGDPSNPPKGLAAAARECEGARCRHYGRSPCPQCGLHWG